MNVKKVVVGGEVRWEVAGWTAGRGSRYLRRRFDRKVDADSFVSDLKLQQAESATKPKALLTMVEQTFEQECKFWMTHRGVQFSPGHKKRATDALEKWIIPQIGHLTLDQINPVVFSNYRIARLKAGLKPGTVNRETEVMMAVLNFAVKQRRIPYNPAAGFTKLEEVREDIRFWERDEASAFLAFTNQKYPAGSEKRWIYVAYLTMLNTAIRASENWGLMPKDLVQGGELLHIQRQFDRVVKDFRPPKGKKSRYVPCNPVLRDELLQLAKDQKIQADQTFFCSLSGRPMDHDNFVSRYFDKDVVEAKVKVIRPHDLRHTGTTLMIAEGVDLRTVQEICGHKDIATTMRYAHLLGDSTKKVARAFSVVPGVQNPSLRVVTG
jgi:integrase